VGLFFIEAAHRQRKMKASKLPRPNARAAVLSAHRAEKMAHSAHAYVRGNTVKFYEWLKAQDRHSLPEGPPIWICGDCHAGNLGPVADATRADRSVPWLCVQALLLAVVG
jgi:uncharacterized protein (DUF2252 family)